MNRLMLVLLTATIIPSSHSLGESTSLEREKEDEVVEEWYSMLIQYDKATQEKYILTLRAIISDNPISIEAKRKVLPLLIHALDSKNSTVRLQAATCLSHLSTIAGEAAPALRGRLTDASSEVRLAVADALFAVEPGSPEAIQTFIALLKDTNTSEVRKDAALSLRNIGPSANASLPALRKCLLDRSATLRIVFAEAVCKIDPKATDGIETIIHILNDADPMLRADAAFALKEYDSRAKLITPHLISAMEDNNVEVRCCVIYALGFMKRRDAILALIKAAQDDNKPVAKEAIHALAMMGDYAKESIPDLVRLYGNADSDVRHEIVVALTRFGLPGKKTIALFRKALHDPSPDVRISAANAVWQYDKGDYKRIAATVRRVLASKNVQARWEAVHLLEKIGEDGFPARELLRVATNDDNESIRNLAELVLRHLKEM